MTMEPPSEEQLRLLTYVRLTPGTTVTKLARLLRATPASVRKDLGQLEHAGLVERRSHPDHPKANELHVTDAGAQTLDAAG